MCLITEVYCGNDAVPNTVHVVCIVNMKRPTIVRVCCGGDPVPKCDPAILYHVDICLNYAI